MEAKHEFHPPTGMICLSSYAGAFVPGEMSPLLEASQEL